MDYWFGIPRKVEHLTHTRYFTQPKLWYFTDVKKSIKSTLFVRDEVISLQFQVPKADIGKYKHLNKVTTKTGRYSRAMAIDGFFWEEALTSLFKRDPASMKGRPQLLVMQNDIRDIGDTITNITGYLPGIGDWFGTNFLDFDHDAKKFKQDKRLYHEIKLGDFITITLYSGLLVSDVMDDFKAVQESYAVIEFSKPATYKSAIRMFGHVENFFNFIFSTPHSTNVFTSNRKVKSKNIKLEIISPSNFRGLSRKERYSGSMLFKFDEVSDVNQLFINWLLEYEKFYEIAEAIVLLKSTKVSEELRFTTIINALEAVHRRYYNTKPQSDEDYEKRIKAILSGVPNGEAAFVEDKLKYGNSMTLRDRIKDVMKMASEQGLEILPNKTLNKAIATRNFLTHGDLSLKSQCLSNNELYTANALLGKYLKFLLLRIIKMDSTELKKIIASSTQFAGYYRDEPEDPTRLM